MAARGGGGGGASRSRPSTHPGARPPPRSSSSSSTPHRRGGVGDGGGIAAPPPPPPTAHPHLLHRRLGQQHPPHRLAGRRHLFHQHPVQQRDEPLGRGRHADARRWWRLAQARVGVERGVGGGVELMGVLRGGRGGRRGVLETAGCTWRRRRLAVAAALLLLLAPAQPGTPPPPPGEQRCVGVLLLPPSPTCPQPTHPACPPCIRGARVAVARTLTSRPPPTHLPSPPRLPPPAHTHTHTEHPPHPLPRCWQPGARARARGIAAAICSAPLPRPPLACLLVTRRGVCAHTAGTQQQHRVTHRCHTGPAFVMRIPRVAGICEAGNDCLHLFQRSNLQEVPAARCARRPHLAPAPPSPNTPPTLQASQPALRCVESSVVPACQPWSPMGGQ